jgi:hypothetical protein
MSINLSLDNIYSIPKCNTIKIAGVAANRLILGTDDNQRIKATDINTLGVLPTTYNIFATQLNDTVLTSEIQQYFGFYTSVILDAIGYNNYTFNISLEAGTYNGYALIYNPSTQYSSLIFNLSNSDFVVQGLISPTTQQYNQIGSSEGIVLPQSGKFVLRLQIPKSIGLTQFWISQ